MEYTSLGFTNLQIGWKVVISDTEFQLNKIVMLIRS